MRQRETEREMLDKFSLCSHCKDINLTAAKQRVCFVTQGNKNHGSISATVVQLVLAEGQPLEAPLLVVHVWKACLMMFPYSAEWITAVCVDGNCFTFCQCVYFSECMLLSCLFECMHESGEAGNTARLAWVLSV